MKKNWMSEYSNKSVKKFQAGGEMVQDQSMGAGQEQQAGGDIQTMIQQFAQSKDPQLAVQIADTLVAMVEQEASAQGGGMQGEATQMARNGMRMRRGPVFNI